jgi:rubrerythrin
MKSEELQAIIDFAIDKEQEAVYFYMDLAGKVNIGAIAEELKKIAKIEEGHRDRLKEVDAPAAASSAAEPVVDLKIADYLVEKEPKPDMTWQDLLQITMKRELSAMNLYTDLSKQVTDPNSKELFKNLAEEERAHKVYFEKIWDEEVLMED